MGLLFTTEGTRRIINTLNMAFDGPSKDPINNPIGLALIQKGVFAQQKLLAKVQSRQWKPARLARMLQLIPYDQGSGPVNTPVTPKPRDDGDTKRWHFFLKSVIADKTMVGGTSAFDTVFVPLQNALADAILLKDSSGVPLFVRVTFDHVELDEYSDPPQGKASLVIFDAPLLDGAGMSLGTARHITLFTVRVLKSQAGTPFDPIDPNTESELPTQPPWQTGQSPP